MNNKKLTDLEILQEKVKDLEAKKDTTLNRAQRRAKIKQLNKEITKERLKCQK